MVGKYGSIDNIIVYLSEEQEVFGKEGSTELETNKSQEHQSPRPTLMLEGSYHHDNHAGHIFLDEESSHNQH